MAIPLDNERKIDQLENSSLGKLPTWETVHTFLTVARQGSFRSASISLNMSINLLRRQIDDMERQLGVELFKRRVDGVGLTAEGAEILTATERMEAAAFSLLRAKEFVNQTLSGKVKISAPEGLQSFWIAPRIVEFQIAYPTLTIDLEMGAPSPHISRDVEQINIKLTRPVDPDSKIVRLGRLHFMPFASRSYLENYGTPTAVTDLNKHRLVLQIGDTAQTEMFHGSPFAVTARSGLATLQTNSSTSELWAVLKGAGIGILPTYLHSIAAPIVPIVPIDLGITFSLDIWLAYHSDALRIPRLRRTIDWLIEAFNPQKFPWFGDEFIHPFEMRKTERQGAFGAPFPGLSPDDLEVDTNQLTKADAREDADEATIEKRRRAIAELRSMAQKRGLRLSVDEIRSWVQEGRT